MRIGFFTEGYLPQPNGVATSVLESAKELEKRGHEVYIVAPRYPGYVDRDPRVIRLTSLKVSTQPEIRLALNLPDNNMRRLLSIEFDIIHGHSGGPITLLGWEIARLQKIPFLVTYHTLWNRYTHYFLKGKVVTPKMMEQATRIFGNRCDRIIAPTARVETELKRYGVKKPISVVPSGINTQAFLDAPRGELRKLINVPSDPIMIFVGRLGAEKSVDFLLKTFVQVLKKVPNAHFAIIGGGKDMKKLSSLAKRLKVDKQTHFVGEVKLSLMPSLYKDADVFVFASTTETQGLVVPEALAAGVPVVVVDDPAYGCVEDGKNGYLVNKNTDQFASKVISILEDRDLQEKMSRAALASGAQFSVSSTVDKLEDIYYKMLEEKRMNVHQVMEKNKRAEQFYVFELLFWITVVAARIFVFFFNNSPSYPSFAFAGSKFTFFEVGAFISLASLALAVTRKSIGLAPLIGFGIGMGLVANEIVSALLEHDTIVDYWSTLNFIPLAIFGLFTLFLLRGSKKETPHFFINTRILKHENPENPRVSVVIPAYNEEAFIATTLKSLLAQTYKNFELIVVDNNSDDSTGDIARRFGAKVIVEKEKGVAAARQSGFMAARGSIIASTDSDSVVPENWLEKIVAAYDQDSKLTAYGGVGCLYSGPVAPRAAGRYLFPPFQYVDKILSVGWNLNGFNLSVRADAFRKIGGFRKEMTIGEDVDLAKRLREVGKVKVDTKFVVYVSGRRYKDGLLKGLMAYIPSYFARVVLKKDEFLTFNPVRSEKGANANLSYVPLVTALFIIAVLFYLSQPKN